MYRSTKPQKQKSKNTKSTKKEYRVALSPGLGPDAKKSVVVKGTPVKIEGFPQVKFFARKGCESPINETTCKEKDKMWILSEVSTGAIIYKGAKTKKALIEYATEFLHKTITEENLLEKIREWPVINS